MARARNIKPGLFKNEILGVADPLYTLAFQGLWVLADREGRLEDRPLRIKVEVFPYREGIDMDAVIDWLQSEGFVIRYSVFGKKYIQITNFTKHQNPHKNEAISEIPPVQSVETPNKSEVVPNKSEALGLDTDSLIPDSLIPEVNPAPAKPARFDPAALPMPQGMNPEKWAEWIGYRRSRKLSTTEATARKQLAFLGDCIGKGLDTGAIIDASITNGWQGLFEPKARGSPSQSRIDAQAATLSALTGGLTDPKQRSQTNEPAATYLPSS